MNSEEIYVFGPFCLSTGRRELVRQDQRVPLGSRAFDLLLALLRRRGLIASKDELMAEVWPGISIEENNLSVQVSALRKGLGEGPREARYVATVPRHGYRFVAPVICPSRTGIDIRSYEDRTTDQPYLSLPDKPAIVVLPFVNLSSEPEQSYFAEGTTEELLSALARCSSIAVIARSFAAADRPLDVELVGRPLGTRYVLRGSVRRSGDHLRVASQLIDAMTGVQIWAEGFAGETSDTFGLQDRVAETVVGAVESQLQLAEFTRCRAKSPSNLNAYDHLLRAQELEYEFTAASFHEALQHLRQALDIDPNYAQAMAFTGYCYGWRRSQGWMRDVASETTEGLRLTWRALELGHFDPAVLWMSAFAAFQLGVDPRRALELAYQSVAANSKSAIGLSVAGRLEIYLGRYETGKDLIRRAHRLNPSHPRVWHLAQAMALACLGEAQYEASAVWARKVLAQNPRHTGAMRVLAANLAYLGQTRNAEETLGENLNIEPDLTISKLHARRLFQHESLWRTFSRGLSLAGMPE